MDIPEVILIATWDDATTDCQDWTAVEDLEALLEKPGTVMTAGFLIKETAKYIMVAQNLDIQDGKVAAVGETMRIRKENIIARKDFLEWNKEQ